VRVSAEAPTRALAEFASTTSISDIPDDITARLPWLLLDNVAAGALGSRQPWFTVAAAVMSRLSGPQAAQVFGDVGRLDVSRAALLNGVAVGGFEAGHGSWGAQPSAAVFPAAFALAEDLHATGEALINALAVGYEVNARVAQAQTNRAEVDRGFHNPSISGVFGAAAACGSILELPADELGAALGIAGSHAAGLSEFVVDGSMTKRLHLGRAAQMGLESALLAAGGFTGPLTALEGRYGFLRAVSPAPRIDRLTEALGEEWVIRDMFVKCHPIHGVSLALVDGVRRWHTARPGNGAGPTTDIESITLRVSADAAEPRHNDPAPRTVTAAQYSVPFSVALTLVYGVDALIGLDVAALTDPEVRRLAAVSTAVHDERFQGKSMRAGGELVLQYADGERETITAPGLTSAGPDALRELVVGNLARYSAETFTSPRQADLIALAETLRTVPDIAVPARLLAADMD
jgi:2-methylcitrate dehydratase PrpD